MSATASPAPRSFAATTGCVFDIQRCSMHDGPGLRTTVFLKGCPLRCRWCHNPESIHPEPVLSCNTEHCSGCGRCVAICPSGAHAIIDGIHSVDRAKCTSCGACVETCGGGALRIVGEVMRADEVMKIVLRDRHFYHASGGLTISGGEPTMQNDFTVALLSIARESGIHSAVETSGFCTREALAALLPVCDLFLYDLKESDHQRHKKYTFRPLSPILQNLDFLYQRSAQIILRCPIIPGVNDRAEHLKFIAKLTCKYPNILGAQIMPYHTLGWGKRSRFGITEIPACVFGPATPELVQNWKAIILRANGKIIR